MLRKLLHITGVIIPLIYLLTDKVTALMITATLLALLGMYEILRIKDILRIDFVEKCAKNEERKRPLGSFFYVLSCLITMALFEKEIAIASLFILAISDPLSSVMGMKVGRIRFLGKSLEGTVTFFCTSFLILICFSFTIPVAAVCAAISSLTELFSSWPVDDNLSIPLAAASALTLLTRF